jgi:hypothetical protein
VLTCGCICWKVVKWHGLICTDTMSSGCNRGLHIFGKLMVNCMGSKVAITRKIKKLVGDYKMFHVNCPV